MMAAMDLDGLVGRLREEEERTAVGWAGALGQEDPAAALREVLRRERSGPHATIGAKVRMDDPQARLLFVTLGKRYGLRAYRGPRQRRGSYMLEGPEVFVQEVYWPLFNACAELVRTEITDRCFSSSRGFGGAGDGEEAAAPG